MVQKEKLLKKQGETAYFFAVLLLALGTVFCAKGELGMSMIAAPAYCLSVLFGGYMGYAEYIVQGVLLIVLCLAVRRFKWQYLTSFFTALIYGLCVNIFQFVMRDLNPDHIAARIVLFAAGTVIVALSVALFFNTYLAPCVYDMFVKALSSRYSFSVAKTKTAFDVSMLLASVVLAILVHGVLTDGDLTSFSGLIDVLKRGGVYIGTFITVLINGILISLFDRFLKKMISFEPASKTMYKYLNYTEMKRRGNE